MKTALIISSFVAASHVGASASAFCLRRLGIRTVLLPTTLLGRHPGWGAPGGGPVPGETLRSMWEGIKAQNLVIDAVMTGYMADESHAALAAEIITHVRANNPFAHILVDPVMGDHGKLYIKDAVAKAIKDTLIPMADIITPNVWELSYISGKPVDSLPEIITALGTQNRDVLVTSVPFEDKIGAMLYGQNSDTVFVRHDKFSKVPHGGGDALAATFLAHILNEEARDAAFARATAAIFDMMATADAQDLGELPLIHQQDALCSAKPLPIERYNSD